MDASLVIFDCSFDVAAQSTFRQSPNLRSSNRFLNATYSSGGKTSNKFLVSFSNGFDRPTSTTFEDFEISVVSPKLSSGVTASRNVTLIGDVTKTGILVSATGQSQKLDLTFEKLSAPGVTNQKLYLKTTLPLAKHVQVDIETKDEVRQLLIDK